MNNFAADPKNDKARKWVRIVGHGNWISMFFACLAAVSASFAMLYNVATVRWLTEYGDPTYLDIVRVIMVGIGTFLLWQATFRLLPWALFRKYLQEGTILKLDDSLVLLDLTKCEDPDAERFRLQRDRNAFLQRHVKKSCRQQ